MASLLVSFASFISFPILTRIFSVDDYGKMNFIAVNLSFLAAVSKLGIQNAIPRFYCEINSGKSNFNLNDYYSTVIFGMTGAGFLFSLIFFIITRIIPKGIWGEEIVFELITFVIPMLIIIKSCESSLINILRAEERSGVYTLYTVIKKYFSLVFILITLFFFAKNLYGFYLASIAAELISLVVLLYSPVFRSKKLNLFSFSPEMYKIMLVFGIPMIAYEMSGIIISIGDRYIINIFLGDYELGIYSAAYNMCEYICLILTVSISQAALPMYINIWENKGEAETRIFLRNAISAYLMISIPLIVGIYLVGDNVLALLASNKYQIDAKLISLISAGILFDGMTVFFAAGLYIAKKTFRISLIIGISALVNVVINLLLVPSIGLIGAAIATLVSYVFLSIAMILSARKILSFHFPFQDAIKYTILSAFMCFIVIQVETPNVILTIASKIFTGVILYSLLILLFHRKAFFFLLDMRKK